jgi:hypothetical protein
MAHIIDVYAHVIKAADSFLAIFMFTYFIVCEEWTEEVFHANNFFFLQRNNLSSVEQELPD